MTAADCLLDAKIDEVGALRREVQRVRAILATLLADPQNVTAREAAKDVLR